jgi:peptide/nickel transport system ATP-binding protein
LKSSVIEVRNLRVNYYTERGALSAVNDVSFDLYTGERLGLVGESGSGKTTAAMALMRLIRPPGKIDGGKVTLDGLSLLELPEERMRQIRLAEIALVAQGAMNSLNPVAQVRKQIEDALRDHGVKLSSRERVELIADLLNRVGLPRSAADMFPHELSGGMKQRACIAIAICLKPKVIIADEPTSALDVVVQHQVMETLENLRSELGASVILIGHDMGLMAQAVDRLGVMYAGDLIETGGIKEIFDEPLHPYTRLLMASLPSLERKEKAKGIPGLMPSMHNRPQGCPFHPRCPEAFDRCKIEKPALKMARPNRDVACHLHDIEIKLEAVNVDEREAA